MKIYKEIDLSDFDPWAGAFSTILRLNSLDPGYVDLLQLEIEREFPDGLTEVELNDLLRFDDDWICEVLHITESDWEATL